MVNFVGSEAGWRLPKTVADAEKALTDGLKATDSATRLAKLTDAIAKHPGLAMAYYWRAAIHAAAERNDLAEAAGRRSWRSSPGTSKRRSYCAATAWRGTEKPDRNTNAPLIFTTGGARLSFASFTSACRGGATLHSRLNCHVTPNLSPTHPYLGLNG